MTSDTLVAAPSSRLRLPFDASGAIMGLFAAILALLILLPLAWIAVFAFSDRARHFTLASFVLLFPGPPFLELLIATFAVALSVSAICCPIAAPMGWVVARADMPWRRPLRLLVMASFVTPPFLGAIA